MILIVVGAPRAVASLDKYIHEHAAGLKKIEEQSCTVFRSATILLAINSKPKDIIEKSVEYIRLFGVQIAGYQPHTSCTAVTINNNNNK